MLPSLPDEPQGPNPGIEPRSPALQADSLPDEPQGRPYLPQNWANYMTELIIPTPLLHHNQVVDLVTGWDH